MDSVKARKYEARKALNYNVLIDLSVCDRVKSCIFQTALQHVLSLESRCDGGWLHLASLVESLDLFYDTHLDDDKPRYTASTASAVSAASAVSHSVNKVVPARPPPTTFGFSKPNNGQSSQVTPHQSN